MSHLAQTHHISLNAKKCAINVEKQCLQEILETIDMCLNLSVLCIRWHKSTVYFCSRKGSKELQPQAAEK